MSGIIYLAPEQGGLLPLSEGPYDSEAFLQDLLADHPALLAGEQMIDGSPRRWLLLSREVPVPSAAGAPWYADHLYVDQDAVPTIVEVKRSTDPRIRREVVGQILDYAANACIRWPISELRARYETSADAAKRMSGLLDGEDEGEFWKRVAVNLEAGRIRMVFVADVIPEDLRCIVDFLARQLKTAEIFAVEVRKFEGAGTRAFVPRLVSERKSSDVARAERQWDEQSFLADLDKRVPSGGVVARSLMDWARQQMSDLTFGKGVKDGSCTPRLWLGDSALYVFSIWTYGRVEMLFQWLKRPPFDTDGRRLEIVQRLNQISGITIPESAVRRRPTFDLTLLDNADARGQFEAVIQWVIDEIRAAAPANAESPV